MNTVKTHSGIRWLVCCTACVLSVILCWMATRHGLSAHWAQSDSVDDWRRAATWEPDNAEHWYRLGRYYQLDFEHADPEQAMANYERATTIAPGSAEYWLNLAEARETARQLPEAEEAFRRAQGAYPLSAEVSWRFGNFLLRQDRQDEAYREIHKALSVRPSLTALAISRCWQSSQDIRKILELVLPPEADAYWGAIDFLVEAREPDAAMEVWKRLIVSKLRFPIKRAFRLQDMLVETGHADDAHAVWRQSLVPGGIGHFFSGDRSLVWSGGFEQELLNGGFDWRFRKVPGVELSFDSHMPHSQMRALRVVFDGTVNVDFRQPWQYVLLQPHTHYRLSAYFRTEDLMTSSPLRLELEEMHFGNMVEATPEISGTQSWAPYETEFTTGADVRLLRLVLRRRPSPKLDNKIHGTVWMDDVSLVPLVESSALQ